jgi:hypothetical protein
VILAIRLFTIFNLLFFSTVVLAMEDSRPLSSSGDNLVEFTLGVAFEERESVSEVGLDYEYFIPAMDHHLSIGLATEVEFLQDGTQYLIAPLVSLYYYHTKVFLASGLLTDFSHHNRWKTRVGVGYEFFLDAHDFIIVPTVAWDIVAEEQYPAIVIGIAREF